MVKYFSVDVYREELGRNIYRLTWHKMFVEDWIVWNGTKCLWRTTPPPSSDMAPNVCGGLHPTHHPAWY